MGPDSLRAVLDSVFDSPAYRWGEEPALARLVREGWQRLLDWLSALQASNPGAFRLFVLVLLLGLLLMLGHAAWVIWRTVRGGTAAERRGAAGRTAEARDAAWYLEAADRAAAEGRLLEALQLAFVGLALTLDREGLLRYHASKTPAECAREARLAPEDGARLRELVRVLYACAFGGGAFSPDDYRRWRAAVAGPWHAPAR